MADVDYFLKLQGVDGESTDEKHSNEIEIFSFSFGASNAGTMKMGTGGGAGKVNMQDFHFMKKFDKASSNLLKRCANGEHIPSAILTCRKATGSGGQQDYLIITFTDVLVSSYQTSGSGGDVIPMDSISLNFTKIEFDYKPQNKDGSLGASIKSGWDTKVNKAT